MCVCVCVRMLTYVIVCVVPVRGGAGAASRRASEEAPVFLGVPTRRGDRGQEEGRRGDPLVSLLELQHAAQHPVPQGGYVHTLPSTLYRREGMYTRCPEP